MKQGDSLMAACETRLVDLWGKMVTAVGIHTVNILMERAVWHVSQKHAQLNLLSHGDDGLSFEALEKAWADRPEKEVSEAFGDLTEEMLLILARLLGKDMAQKLSQELDARLEQRERGAP